MTQPVPQVTEADYERILKREFPNHTDTARAILEEYGKQDWHREILRVRIAILKNANGNLDNLRQQLETANQDYRDTLVAAEYPQAFDQIPSFTQPPSEKQKTIIQSDWQNYQTWFHR